MDTSTFDRHRKACWLLFGLLLAALTAWIAMRNHGINPTVFADEWYYSKMARLLPLAEALVPSYLYLWLFSASTACSAGFLECVRGANLAFYLAATPFLYLIARRHMGRGYAAAIVLLSMAAPLNQYTAYFMPEATYYFGFCVLSWIMLTRDGWPLALRALAGGAMLGAMSLVKVHALFLVPALCLYLGYASWHIGGAWLARGLAAAVVAGAVTVGVKFGLGFLLAGDAGLSLLGPFYQGAANSDGASARLALLAPAFINGRGHLMALAALLGLPLAVLVHGLCASLARGRRALRVEGEPETDRLRVYVLLMLGAALGMTVMYTATLARPDSNEGVRLHLRYYSFVFPMLWIGAAAAMHQARAQLPRLRWIIAALMAALLVLAWFRLPGYASNLVDGPDIAALLRVDPPARLALGLLVCLQLALLGLWAAGRGNAGRLFLFTALPFSLLVAQQSIWTWTQAHRPDGHGDRAARVVLQHVPLAERGQIMVVGNEMTQVMRVQFHIDNPDTVGLELRDNAPLADYQIPVGQKWLLVMDRRDVAGAGARATVVHRAQDFTLLRLPAPEPVFAHVKLSEAPDPGFITAIEGLSAIEPWGRWSDAKRVVIHFAQPLPARFGLVINGRAYGDNANQPFTVQVGNTVRQFRLDWHTKPVNLLLETDGTAKSLVIEVPKPTSPAELGSPGDARTLGIGIADLTFTSAGPAAP